jgi:hypothetical protein
MQCRVHIQIEPPCREAARAIDVQLQSVAGDVADGLERKCAEHASDLGRGYSGIIGLH